MCEKFLIQLSLAFMETIKTTFLTGKDKILCYMPFMGQMEEACSHWGPIIKCNKIMQKNNTPPYNSTLQRLSSLWNMMVAASYYGYAAV